MDNKNWLFVSELTSEDYEEAGIPNQMYSDENIKIKVEENDLSNLSIASDIEEHDSDEELDESENDDEVGPDQISIPCHKTQQNKLQFGTKPGPARKTKRKSEVQIFNMLMSPEIVDIIIQETNRKASHHYKITNGDKSTNLNEWKPMTISEFHAYIGILLFSGATRSNDVDLTELWSTDGYPIYRSAMSFKRFMLINRFIRFDNGETRPGRIQRDKATVIRHIWTIFNCNLQDCFIAGTHVGIDDQFFQYSGKIPFKKYIISGSKLYGIKITWLTDVTTSYPLLGHIWTGPKDKNEIQSIFAKCEKKIEVNAINKLLQEYSTKRKTSRWSHSFFYNILDVAALASFIICMENNFGQYDSTKARRQFLQNLAKTLVMPEVLMRSSNPQVMQHFGIRRGIECILGRPVELKPKMADVPPEARDKTGRIRQKGRCKLCNRKRPTRQCCIKCHIPVCAQHSRKLVCCVNCRK